MSVTELFQNVRKVVQTGLVVDIPWLPDFQMFAEDVYVKPKDYDNKYVNVRNAHLRYAISSIESGSAKLPGEGSALQKTVRAIKGLEQMDVSVLDARGEGLIFWEQKIPQNYDVKAASSNVGIAFTSPERAAYAISSITDSMKVDKYVQGLAEKILSKERLYYPHRRPSSRIEYYELITKENKQTLERIVNTPENLRVTDDALGKLKDIADGNYGLPLSEVKDPRQI